MLGVEVWGHSGTSVKEQGSHDLDIRLWGTKGLCKRRRCIGTERARTQLLFHSILFTRIHMRACASKGEVWHKIHIKPNILPDQLYTYCIKYTPSLTFYQISYIHIV